jgi:hypothetical protein
MIKQLCVAVVLAVHVLAPAVAVAAPVKGPTSRPSVGPASRPASAPKAEEVFGVRRRPQPAPKPLKPGDPRRVTFVVSRAGSMVGDLRRLEPYVLDRIAELDPVVSFNLIMYSTAPAKATWKAPVAATDANKAVTRRVYADNVPHGMSEPLAALTVALAERPEVIYLYTNGVSADPKADLGAEVAKLNRSKTKIMVFVPPGPEDEKKPGVDAFRKLAESTGGTLRVLTEDELK